jgi:hypothetical protein
MSFNPTTEFEALRHRAEWAENELKKIERETALAAIERRDEIAREETRKATEAEAAQHAAELEGHRVNAWVNHRVDLALASANPDDALAALLSHDPKSDVPKDASWPPGVCATDYAPAVAAAAMPHDEKIGGTALGQMLAAKGVTV